MLASLAGFRIRSTYDRYPPYHRGLYLEDYFYRFYTSLKIKPQREFIPVTWTACYIQRKTAGLQEQLDRLDRSKSYFTVSQHDDAVIETLPTDTLCFAAGGNRGGIPIPLVCSSIPRPPKKRKDLLCSFVGSFTHPIRLAIHLAIQDKADCFSRIKGWNARIGHEEMAMHLDAASRSQFLLCPRGIGLNSFRLYEAFQLGAVPVIITDQFFLPWSDELDWKEFAVLLHTNEVGDLYDRLKSISKTKRETMVRCGRKLYEHYFTLAGTCRQILKRLK